MSYNVEVVTEEGDDWRQLLRIQRNGETVEEHADSGEPEDNCFHRDWAWGAARVGIVDLSERNQMSLCNDCPSEINNKTMTRRTGREDVCDSCWDTRGKLVRGELLKPGTPEFIRVQKAMSNGHGTAKRLIAKLVKEQAIR